MWTIARATAPKDVLAVDDQLPSLQGEDISGTIIEAARTAHQLIDAKLAQATTRLHWHLFLKPGLGFCRLPRGRSSSSSTPLKQLNTSFCTLRHATTTSLAKLLEELQDELASNRSGNSVELGEFAGTTSWESLSDSCVLSLGFSVGVERNTEDISVAEGPLADFYIGEVCVHAGTQTEVGLQVDMPCPLVRHEATAHCGSEIRVLVGGEALLAEAGELLAAALLFDLQAKVSALPTFDFDYERVVSSCENGAEDSPAIQGCDSIESSTRAVFDCVCSEKTFKENIEGVLLELACSSVKFQLNAFSMAYSLCSDEVGSLPAVGFEDCPGDFDHEDDEGGSLPSLRDIHATLESEAVWLSSVVRREDTA